MHENGCSWKVWTCAYAAKYNKVKCLKYAHENGDKLSKWVCKTAVKHNSMECLKYAYENDCPYDYETMKNHLFHLAEKYTRR